MVLSSDEVVVYDVTPMSCLESERLPRSDLFVLFREVSDASTPDRLVLYDEGVNYYFERLPTLPPGCEEPPQEADARLRLDVVANYLDVMYPSFAAREVEWALVRDRAKTRVRP